MKFQLTATSDIEEVFEKYKAELDKLGFRKEKEKDANYSYSGYFIDINTLEELMNLIDVLKEELFSGRIIVSKNTIEIYNNYLY